MSRVVPVAATEVTNPSILENVRKHFAAAGDKALMFSHRPEGVTAIGPEAEKVAAAIKEVAGDNFDKVMNGIFTGAAQLSSHQIQHTEMPNRTSVVTLVPFVKTLG